MKNYDAFISHASEDKRYFVRQLSQKLQDYGAKIWYDEFSLKPGVSLSRSIEHGLSNSKFGLVVLSEAFFKKKWTEYELRALNSFEIDNPGVIIPIWYKVTLEQVRNFSPYLSDKLAIVFDKKSIDDTAIEILETIREDLFEEILRKKAWSDLIAKGEIKKMTSEEAKEVQLGPIRHETLPIELIIRVRVIRTILFDVYPHSFEFWIEGFQRDLHPENEIHIWEKIATCYSESIIVLKILEGQKKQEVFSLTFGLFNGIEKEEVEINHLTENEVQIVTNICEHPIPYYDIEDRPFGKNGS